MPLALLKGLYTKGRLALSGLALKGAKECSGGREPADKMAFSFASRASGDGSITCERVPLALPVRLHRTDAVSNPIMLKVACTLSLAV